MPPKRSKLHLPRSFRGLRVLCRARDRAVGWRAYFVEPWALDAFVRACRRHDRRVIEGWREDWNAYEVTVYRPGTT